ncbi:MAG: 7-cyano-7-deazaguanine synthase, partial [Thermogutta sp.]
MGREAITNSDGVAVLLSGGLDSAITLMIVAGSNSSVFPLYIKCGLTWENEELKAAKKICNWFDDKVAPLVQIDLPVAPIYGAHWSLTGQKVPSAD